MLVLVVGYMVLDPQTNTYYASVASAAVVATMTPLAVFPLENEPPASITP